MRRRTLVWARIGASAPNTTLPPVWSPCQWVLITNLSLPPPAIPCRAARIFGASGSNWSSTIRMPSSPTEAPMLPPDPSSMYTLPATGVTLISTFERSRACAAAGDPSGAKTASQTTSDDTSAPAAPFSALLMNPPPVSGENDGRIVAPMPAGRRYDAGDVPLPLHSSRPDRRRQASAPPPSSPLPPAAAALGVELAARLRGEVRFDAGSRALYATDGSNYRQVPIGVVLPRDAEDVLATLAACRRHGVPVLARGGGTSLAGQCCNVAVVLDFSKYMHRLVELDPERRLARVEPGIVLDTLRRAAERHHLTYGPDPASHDRCTLGGMIGNNSCGVHALMAGKTVDNVEELEVLTYDGLRLRVGPTADDELARIVREGGRRGQIYAGLASLRDRFAALIRERYPDLPRRVSGYNLDQLLPENGFHVARALVGTEGTCATVLAATVRLVPSPPFRTLVVLGYADVFTAADHVPEILAWRPIGLEGMDDRLIGFMRAKRMHRESIARLPPGGAWLLVEFGGASQAEADAPARRMAAALRRLPDAPAVKVLASPREARKVWEVREAALGATAFVPGRPENWEGW